MGYIMIQVNEIQNCYLQVAFSILKARHQGSRTSDHIIPVGLGKVSHGIGEPRQGQGGSLTPITYIGTGGIAYTSYRCMQSELPLE